MTSKGRLFVWAAVLATLYHWGCAGPKQVQRPVIPEVAVKISPPAEEELKEIVISRLEEGKEEELREIVISRPDERKELEKVYSLSLYDADIREVLLAFSRETELNIVVDPDLSGRVTANLKNVTLDEALDALLAPIAFQFKREGTFVRISRIKMETRVFFLQYMTTTRTGSGSMSATAGALSTGTSSLTSADAADPWTDIEAGLGGMISPGGSLVLNRMAGCVVITDFSPKLKQIARFLEEIEGSIQRQVMIEAKIVEVALSKGYELGLDWSAIGNLSNLEIAGLKIRGPASATASQSLSPTSGILQIGVSGGDITALLNAMSTQGELNMISSPRVATLNNQKAIIKVGTTDIFWEVTSTYDPETKQYTTIPVSRTVDVGLVLAVTPQISPDGNVTMHIHPSITDKIGESTFESQTIKATVPILSVRETDTVIKVGDGQTIVLAGLMQEKKTEDTSKVPILGDIPGLKTLFRRTKYLKVKTELAILLTPTILVGRRVEDLSRDELIRLDIAP
ncbi:MAG: secretin and TonB N-terminal domain-containing protein [Candidatus Latescibacterota bacterium]